MPARIPYVFLGAFMTTVFALQWWQLPAYPLWLWLALGGVLIVGLLLRTRGLQIIALTLGVAIAFLSIARATTTELERPIEAWAHGKRTVEGIVIGQPDDRQVRMQYVLSVSSVQEGTGAITLVSDRILLNDRRMMLRPAPGERLRVTGKLALPMDTEDFSYTTYLAMDGIHAVMDIEQMESLGLTAEEPVQRMLWQSRMAFEAHISRIYPDPAASLLSGLLTGSRRGLPPALTEDFRTTGLSHIVAVSGSNITILLSVITGALFFLPLKWRLLPSAIAIIIFTLFVGAEASVMRAAVMGILGLIALQAERLTNIRLTILWSAFFMLVWNPLQLWVDMGFQLSFLAVIGLAELTPLLTLALKKVPATAGLRDAFITTMAAQFTAMPWGAARFGALSLISPISNVIVAPLTPVAMFAGFGGVAAGMIWEPLGRIAGLPGLFALETVIALAQWTAKIPFASVQISWAGTAVITVYYIALVIAVIFIKKRLILPAVQKNGHIAPESGYPYLTLGNTILQAEGMAQDARADG